MIKTKTADYNPEPGTGIEDVTFRNIRYDGDNVNPSRIYGYDGNRGVNKVAFINLQINGERIEGARTDVMLVNAYARNITFVSEDSL
ncbi:hypothetical protein D3C81_1690810 [compost metagenome]